MARLPVATTCGLLAVAVIGVAVSIAGVSSGWAYGAAHDIHPKAGGWAPSPWGPSGDLTVQLGWWNASTTMKSSFSDFEITDSTAGARALGVTTVVAYSLSALLALCIAYLAVAYSGVVQLPMGMGMEASILIDNSDDTIAYMMWAQTVAGAVTLVLATALYAALAFGAHKAVKDKSAELGQDVNLWPYPSWAFLGALLAGCCQLGVARVFQGALTNAGHTYQPIP